MFALFFSLYLAMFRGTWTMYNFGDIFWQSGSAWTRIVSVFKELGVFITSIFNNVDTPMDTLGISMMDNGSILYFISFILALITSIGIVVVATKGIKKLFTVFFYGVR